MRLPALGYATLLRGPEFGGQPRNAATTAIRDGEHFRGFRGFFADMRER